MTYLDERKLPNDGPHHRKTPHDPDTLPLGQLLAFIVVPPLTREQIRPGVNSWCLSDWVAWLKLVLVQPLKHVRDTTRVEVVQPSVEAVVVRECV